MITWAAPPVQSQLISIGDKAFSEELFKARRLINYILMAAGKLLDSNTYLHKDLLREAIEQVCLFMEKLTSSHGQANIYSDEEQGVMHGESRSRIRDTTSYPDEELVWSYPDQSTLNFLTNIYNYPKDSMSQRIDPWWLFSLKNFQSHLDEL